MKISKILAVFMATAMLFCAMSVSAFAAETYEITSETDWIEVSQKVQDGDTLKLMNDVVKDDLKNYEFHADVTIDLNGKTLTLNGDNVFRSVTFKNGTIKTIDVEKTPRTVTGLFWINCEGGDRALNFENVTVEAASLRGFSLITSYKGGNNNKLTVNISNSKFNIIDPNNIITDTTPTDQETSGEGSFVNGVEEVNITNNSQIKISDFARGFVSVNTVKLDSTSSIEMKNNSKSAFRNSGAVIEGTLRIDNVDIAIENDNNASFTIKKTANVSIANSKTTDVVLGDNAAITIEDGANNHPFAAKITENKYYTSLSDAVAAAKNGDTITLLKDTQEGGIVVKADKYATGITIDLNNHKYEIIDPTVGSTGTETNGMQLLKGNKITIKNGTITSTVAKHLIQNYCDLTLENMTMDGTKLAGAKPYTVSHSNGTLTLTNSTINAHTNGIAFDVCVFGSYSGAIAQVDASSKINGFVELAVYGDKTFDGKLIDYKNTEITALGLYKQNADGSFGKFAVETKIETPTITVPENSNITLAEGASNAAIEATQSKTNTALEGASLAIKSNENIVASDKVNQAITDLTTSTSAEVKVVVVPKIEMEVKEATTDTESGVKTLTLEIEAKYDVIATTEPDNITADNSIKVEEGKKLEITQPVTLTIPLPAGFAASDSKIYIKHTKDNGKTYIYEATVSADGKTATFVNPNGFSTFEATTATPAAKIGTAHYETLSAAVAAVQDGETVTLMKDNAENVSVSRTVKFTMEKNSFNFSGTITAGSRTTLTMDGENTYSFVYSSPSGGGGGGSSVSYYTVSFESNGGSKVASESVRKNTTLTAPTAPTKENYEFDAWYTDKKLTEKFDFDTKITKSITLYAKWVAKTDDTPTNTDTPATDNTTPSKTITMTLGSKNIVANGVSQTADVAPMVKNNRTMLPTRFVSENLGCTVHWDKATNSIQISGTHAQSGEEVNLVLVIGEKTATVNGKTVALDCATFVENNRNYTPIRFIAEALGANVDWNGTTKQITITIPA